MYTQIDIDTTWKLISDYAQSGFAWLDYDDDNASGSMDVRVLQSNSAPSETTDFTKGMKVFKPTHNDDKAILSSQGSAYRWYARCKDGTAKISVDFPERNDLNNMVDRGKLYFMQTRTRASAADRIVIIRTGAKRVNFFTYITSGLAMTIDFIEGVTPIVGASIPIRNLNRNFSDNNTIAKAYTGTYTGGTNISPNQSGFGSNPGQASSGGSGDAIKYQLKPNTDYAYLGDPDSSTDSTSRGFIWEED